MANPIIDLYEKKKTAQRDDRSDAADEVIPVSAEQQNPLMNLYARKKARDERATEAKPQIPAELTAPWRAYTTDTPAEELTVPKVLRPAAVKKYRFQQGTAVPDGDGMARMRGESPEYAGMLADGMSWEEADRALVRQMADPSRNVLDEERKARNSGGVVLPSGTILRREDMKSPNADIGTFFRQVVEPRIEAAESAAEKRYDERVAGRSRTWGESLKAALRAVPLGGEASAAQLTRQAGESRRERGPARIVQDVLAGIDAGQANAYIADHLKDDPEFAEAAGRLAKVAPEQAGEGISEKELQQAVASMTPAQRKQYEKRVAEEQQRISTEQDAFGKAASAAWTRQAEKFRQGITAQLVEEMARRNMPKNELEAFARTAYNASIPGMMMEWAAGNVAGDENKALYAQIMQRAMEKYDPSLATKIGGEVAGLLLSGPVFSAGGAAGKTGAAGIRKIAERNVMKRLMSRGITEGAEGVARRLVAGSTAQQLAQAAVMSGTTLGSYDAVATPLAMAVAGENVSAADVLGATGRGFATGMLLPGIGMAAGRAANAATSQLGRYAAELGGFAAENAAFVGMGTLYNGLRTGEWGSPEQLAEEFGHSVGVLGIMKSIGALKRGRTKNPGFYDKVLAETEFTPEEVEALGRAGVDGRSYKRAVFDLLNAKETVTGREVAERAAEMIGGKYADVMQSPEVPISAKAKLMYLVEGSIPARVPLTTDVQRTVGEDGRTTVDLLDPAGNLVQRRTFPSEKAAEAFERESAGVRKINTVRYYENRLEEQRARTALDDAAQAYAADRGIGADAVKAEVRKAAQGQAHDTELVRQVVERARPLREQYDDVPALIAEGVSLKYGFGEGGFERALSRREEVRTPREREAVAEYAERLKEFATQEQQAADTPERRAERQLMQVAGQAIDTAKNRDDEVIYTATMQDGRQANIVKGANLAFDPETGEIDATQSEQTVVVRYDDGTMRQVSVREIDMIVEVISADDARAAAMQEVRAQLDAAAREEALADAAANGGMVQLKDGRIGVVDGENADGTYSIAILDGDGQIITEQVAVGDITGPVETEQAPEALSAESAAVPGEDVAGAAAPEAQRQTAAVPEAQAPVPAAKIPLREDGQPDFNAMPSDMLAVELSAIFGHDKAVERLQAARKVHVKEVEKLRKAQEETGDLNKAVAVEQRISVMQEEDARLAGALEQLGVTEEPAVREAAAENFSQEIDRLFPEGLPDVRTRVLSDIARGQRFVWSDSPDGSKRGVAAELGFTGNEAERRARFGMLGTEATGAKHVSRYVHDLWQDSNGYAFDMDDAALRNEVIDVLLSTPSRTTAMEQLRDMAARNTEDRTQPRDAEEAAAMQAYEAQRKAFAAAEHGTTLQDDVPFSVREYAAPAPAGVTPERWGVIVEQLRRSVGEENVVTDPVTVKAAYDRIMQRGAEVRRHQVEQATERFNTQMELFTEGKLPSGEKIGLGTPGATLLACGISDADITVTQRVLKDHMNKHGLTADDIKDLPAALENPVMVYEWGAKSKATVVITEIARGDERIAVALKLKPGRNGAVVNAVASVHGKSVERLLADMNTPLTDFGTENLKWVDKEKVLDWITAGSSEGSSGSDQGLVTATNIVTNFENPKIGPENMGRSVVAQVNERPPVEISNRLQVIDLKINRIDLSRVNNRRFMVNPKTGTLILGDEKFGHGADLVAGSHSEEFYDSGVKENFDGFIRGWVGYTSKGRYKDGVIHFAPGIAVENFSDGFEALQLFRAQDGVNGSTIIRSFGNIGEQSIKDLFDPNARYFRTQDGEVYGFTAGGKIYLDGARMNAETPMHEYAELWSQIVAREQPGLWERGVELMKQTAVWDQVNADPNYKHLPEELRASETLSRVAAEIFDEKQATITDDNGLFGRLRDWLCEIWDALKATFSKWTKRDLEKLSADDFARMPLRDFVEGIDLRKYHTAKAGERTLAGVHNLSEEKLSHAVKMGGLANPSMAVINTDMGGFDSFGEISLLAPRTLIDKNSGKNAGTWAADAYTPRYPRAAIEYRIPEKARTQIRKIFKDAGIPNAARHILSQIEDHGREWLYGEGMLQYLFLRDKGIDVAERNAPKYEEPIRTGFVTLFDTDSSTMPELSDEQRRFLTDVRIGEMTRAGDNIGKYKAKYADEDGLLPDKSLLSLYGQIRTDIAQVGQIDEYKTGSKASEYIEANGMADEFRDYMDKWYESLGIGEKLFNGYSYAGDRRYLPHTLANVSKMMKREGRAGGERFSDMGAVRATLTPAFKKLEEIRSEKERIVSHDEFQAAKEELKNEFDELVELTKTNKYDYAADDRFGEAMLKSDPKSYLKQEYNINVTDEDAQRIKELAYKLSVMPTEYFETKFERPVFLNEFAGAVIPENASAKTKAILDGAGISYRTYHTEEERSEILRTFSEELGDVRFNLNSEKAIIRKQAQADGTYMKAPNGEPTKLTADQWETVRTRQFKEWFGDWENDPENASKVVDGNGEPLVAYHGTDSHFSTFQKSSRGIWFTPNFDRAQRYAIAKTNDRYRNVVVPAFLNLKNPDSKEYDANVPFNKRGHDGWISRFDGEGEDGRIFTIVVANPNQVKSATENNGAFDAANPDIRFSFIGEKGAGNLDKAEEATIRMDNLSIARDMEKAGKGARAVKMATGWERGADGKWRYEVPDVEIQSLYIHNKKALPYVIGEDASLFDAYPALRKTVVRFGNINFYNPETDAITLNRKYFTNESSAESFNEWEQETIQKIDQLERKEARDESDENELNRLKQFLPRLAKKREAAKPAAELFNDAKLLLIHEIQHAIQHIEGFAKGGSPEYVRAMLEEYIAGKSKNAQEAQRTLAERREIVSAIYKLEAAAHWLRNPRYFLRASEHFAVPLGSKEETIARGQKMAQEYYWDVMNDVDNGHYGEYFDFRNEYPKDTDHDAGSYFRSQQGVTEVLEGLKKALRKVDREIRTNNYKATAEEFARLTQAVRDECALELYRRLGGEVEARNVERRVGMTPEERRASLAAETEDVARKDQIVLRNVLVGNGASHSVDVPALERPENNRAVLLGERENIPNFGERPSGVDPVASTVTEPESDAHLQAVEEAVVELRRVFGFENPVNVVRNEAEFIERCRELGVPETNLEYYAQENCPNGIRIGDTVLIRANDKRHRVDVEKTLLHEQAHFVTRYTWMETDAGLERLYDAAVEAGADYMNHRLEQRDRSYHVDADDPESMIDGINEMISRNVDILWKKGILQEYVYAEGDELGAVDAYMSAHGVPEGLKKLVLYQCEALKYGKTKVQSGKDAASDYSRLFPAGESHAAANVAGGGVDGSGREVAGRGVEAGGAGVARNGDGYLGGGRGRNINPSFPDDLSGRDSKPDPKITRQQQLIAELRRAVRDSKASARAVAQIVSRRVREDVGRDLVEVMGKREFDALVRQIEQATARQEIEKPLQRIAGVVLDLEIKRIQTKIDKFLQMKVQGETPRGVAIGKVVDDQTRQVFEIFRDNIGRPGDVVMEELRNRDDLDYFSVLDSANVLDVYNDTLRYRRDIADIKREQVALYKENTELRKQRIEANRAGNTAGFVALQEEIAGRKELIEALDAEGMQAQEHLMNALKATERFLSDLFGLGREMFTEWHEQQDARRKEIVKAAFGDVGDGKRIPVLEKQPGVWEQGYRRTMDFLLSPAYSMDYLLKMLSVNAPKGEGAMYDHFMRGEDGYVEARGRYYRGYEDFKRVLDEKARELFGKSYPEVIADSAALTDAVIKITNGQVKETFSPTIGEALYICMADKMEDGRVKLRRMGIQEEKIDALATLLPPQYVRFAAWLQNEFLPLRRKTYNATHLAVFGTQMAEIENYVPLRVAKQYVYREVRGDEPDPDTLPSAITGSIIRRTRNELTLNLHTNALDLMLEHGRQMEHWNAFTRVVLDMNALLSNTSFRRMLDARNPGLHKRLKVAAQLAADTYRPQTNDVNRAWIALGKLAATSKIAFRVNTALKQVLSYPAFYAYSPDPEFWKLLSKNLAPTTWAKNFRWCIDNIPSFHERWLGRMAGNEKLAQMTAPALDKWLDKMNRYGMLPNAFVDALTCANGAMAVYDFRRAAYIERGRDEAEAERLARIDAAVSINATQQSGEGMYLGQMQADRDFWSVSLSTFQNSNFAYLRKQLEGIDELFRDAKRERANRAEYYKEQGFTEGEAFDRALKEVVEAKRGALLHIAVFMFGLNMLWALGNNVWKYLFASDTRDEIPGELAKSALMAPLRNTTVGSIAESFADGHDANPSVLLSDMVAFTSKLRRIVEKENHDAWNETAAYLAMQTLTANGLGIDLESFVNMYQGIAGMIRDGMDVEDLMRVLNAPQSQAKLIAGAPKEGETEEEYRQRMIFTERRITGRVNRTRLDKWTRNYTAYRQAEAMGMDAERDKFGSVIVPELKRLDAGYAAALKSSGMTAGGDMREDYDWASLTPEQRERWRQRARLVWQIGKAEKALDTVVVFNEGYARRMRELMKQKENYINEVGNNK